MRRVPEDAVRAEKFSAHLRDVHRTVFPPRPVGGFSDVQGFERVGWGTGVVNLSPHVGDEVVDFACVPRREPLEKVRIRRRCRPASTGLGRNERDAVVQTDGDRFPAAVKLEPNVIAASVVPAPGDVPERAVVESENHGRRVDIAGPSLSNLRCRCDSSPVNAKTLIEAPATDLTPTVVRSNSSNR